MEQLSSDDPPGTPRFRCPADTPGTLALPEPRAVVAGVQRAGAGRGGGPTLAAARAAEVPGHLLLQPGRVLHDPGLGPARAARAGRGGAKPRRADAAGAAGAHPRDRAGSCSRMRRTCSRGSCSPGWPSTASASATGRALGKAAQERAQTYFRDSVFPVLTPLAVDPGHPFPFLSNLSLSLAVEARDPETGERRFARVKVPESLPRFVPLDRMHESPDERASRRVPAARAAHRRQPGRALPGDGDPRLLSVPRHARHGHRDPGGGGARPAAHRRPGDPPAPLRRLVRLEVHPGTPQRIRELLLEKLEIDEEDVYEESRRARRVGADVASRAAPRRPARSAVRPAPQPRAGRGARTRSRSCARATSCSTTRTTRSSRC